MSQKFNVQLYILFSGFLYFMANIAVIIGYASGCRYFRYYPMTLFEAIRTLIILSFVIVLISPVVWGFMKHIVERTCLIMFMIMIVITIVFDFLFYGLASASV